MRTNKKAVLMMSLGTPDSPGWFDVASYLSQFLTDKRIINIPWLLRYVLVNLIIVPTRAFSSSKSYKELWTERGSPCLLYTSPSPRDAHESRMPSSA